MTSAGDSEKRPQQPAQPGLDNASDERFVSYFATASLSDQTTQRFLSLQGTVMQVLEKQGRSGPFDVADIGCGAGTQCLIWTDAGNRVHGLDVNARLIEIARERAAELGASTRFYVGSAAALPWPDESMDICLVPELLEHVGDWRSCLREFARVLRPGGLLFISTTNKLCPVQHEFNLPLYSWFPGFLKRRYERLSVTTKPELVNYAKYPAVNWFTYFGLRRILNGYGFRSMDRFDVLHFKDKGPAVHAIVTAIRRLPPLRLLAHMATVNTELIALKHTAPSK